MRRYYGFEYWNGMSTTTGERNKYTGRMSIAGETKVFKTQEKLDTWINNTYPKEKGRRIACTKLEIRQRNMGMGVKEFNEHLDMLCQ